jgi:transcriptional regulator with XRE-family HTH domain
MLNRQQLKEYRELRGLSTRDVAHYCDLSQPLIVQVENGDRGLTEYNYRQIVDGINAAYAAKKLGTFEKAPRVNVPKTKNRKKKEAGNEGN